MAELSNFTLIVVRVNMEPNLYPVSISTELWDPRIPFPSSEKLTLKIKVPMVEKTPAKSVFLQS